MRTAAAASSDFGIDDGSAPARIAEQSACEGVFGGTDAVQAAAYAATTPASRQTIRSRMSLPAGRQSCADDVCIT